MTVEYLREIQSHSDLSNGSKDTGHQERRPDTSGSSSHLQTTQTQEARLKNGRNSKVEIRRRSLLPIPVNTVKLKGKVGDSHTPQKVSHVECLPSKSTSNCSSTAQSHYKEEVEKEFPLPLAAVGEIQVENSKSQVLDKVLNPKVDAQLQNQNENQHQSLLPALINQLKISRRHQHHRHYDHVSNMSMPCLNYPTKKRNKKKIGTGQVDPKNKNNNFTLYPSSPDQHLLDDGDRKKIQTLSKVVKLMHESKFNSSQPPAPINTNLLVITKQLEYFPNRNGDHHICYFVINNTSCHIYACQISTNRPNCYSITPSTAYIPQGRSVSVCLKVLNKQIKLRELQKDRVIIKSFVPPTGPNSNDSLIQQFLLLETTNLSEKGEQWRPPVATTSLQLKNFVIHPCSVAYRASRTSFDGKPRVGEELLNNSPLSPSQKEANRRERLKNRNFGEKVFNEVQLAVALSLRELKICQKRSEMIGNVVVILTYLMFIGTLGVAGYLCCYGAKLKPAISIHGYDEDGSRNVNYSNLYFPIRWLYKARGYFHSASSILFQCLPSIPLSLSLPSFTQSNTFYGWACDGFQTFVQHPISFCLNWVAERNPFFV